MHEICTRICLQSGMECGILSLTRKGGEMHGQERRQYELERAADCYDSENYRDAVNHLQAYFNSFGLFTSDVPETAAYFMRGFLLYQGDYNRYASEKNRLLSAKSDFEKCIKDDEMGDNAKNNISIITNKLQSIEQQERREEALKEYQEIFGEGVVPCHITRNGTPCKYGDPKKYPGGCDGLFCSVWAAQLRRWSD